MPHPRHLAASLPLLLALAASSPALALSPIPPAAMSMTPSGTSVLQSVGFDVWLRRGGTFREVAAQLQLVDAAGEVIPARVIPSAACARPIKKGGDRAAHDRVERKCQRYTIKALKPMPVGRVTLRHREARAHGMVWRDVAVYTVLKGLDREAPVISGPVVATDASPGMRTTTNRRRVVLTIPRPGEAHPHSLRYRLDCTSHPSRALEVRDGGGDQLHAESAAGVEDIAPQTTCTVVVIDASDNEGRSAAFRWPAPAKVPAQRVRGR